MNSLHAYDDSDDETSRPQKDASNDSASSKPSKHLLASSVDFAPDVPLSASDGKTALELAINKPVAEGAMVLHNIRADALWTEEQGPVNPYRRVSFF